MNQNKGNDKQKNTAPVPSIADTKEGGHSTTKSAEKADACNHDISQPWNRKDKLQAWFDGLLVAFTFILATVSIAQWCVTKENMRVANRAYLALGQVQIYCPICDSGKIPPPAKANDNNAAINLWFVNSGHSPARDIDWTTMLYIAPMDADFTFPEQPDILEQPKHASIQPSTQFPLQISRGTRAEIVITARQGQDPLYIYGHIGYIDVFDRRHTLLYCTKYQPAATISPESWGLCPYHNEEYDGEYNPKRK